MWSESPKWTRSPFIPCAHCYVGSPSLSVALDWGSLGGAEATHSHRVGLHCHNITSAFQPRTCTIWFVLTCLLLSLLHAPCFPCSRSAIFLLVFQANCSAVQPQIWSDVGSKWTELSATLQPSWNPTCVSESQSIVIKQLFPIRDYSVSTQETVWVGTTRGVHLTSGGQRPGMLLNVSQCTAHAFTTIIWPKRSLMLRLRNPIVSFCDYLLIQHNLTYPG